MPVSNADLYKQLEEWGFRYNKMKYGRILMKCPTGGHVLTPRLDATDCTDTSVIHNASHLLGISVDRFWLGPLDESPSYINQTKTETPTPTIDTNGTSSSSKRFASSYQAEILRYLDNLPGSTLKDQRLGVARAIWSAIGTRSGQNLSSCGSSLSALESDGRVVSSYGHRSLDGKLCRTEVSVLAEPPVGVAMPPIYPVELSPLLSTSHIADESAEHKSRQVSEQDAELMAHIAHLSEEVMLWSDMATELEFSLVEARQKQSDETSVITALDEICDDIARKDVLIRWRDRQVRHRDAIISMLSQQLQEVRCDYEAVRLEYKTLQSIHASSAKEQENLTKRITRLATTNQQLQSELTDLKVELRDTKASLERVQQRMFLSVAETLANGLNTDDSKDLANRTLTTLLTPKDPFMSSGAIKHPFHLIISQSSHRGVNGFSWELPDLPRQSIYEQPVNQQEIKKELSKTVGSWYGKLLMFCVMMEDVLGQEIVVTPKDEYGFCRVTLPVEIRAIDHGSFLVAGDKQIDLRANTGVFKTVSTDSTCSTTEILVAPSNIGSMYLTGQNRTKMRKLPHNDLWVVMVNVNDEKQQPLVRIPYEVLQKNVDHKRIDSLLSHGNKLFGLREMTPLSVQHRNLALITTLLGMGGWTHMSSSKNDPREVVFNHGDLTGLRGRVLYFHNTTDVNLKSQLLPVAHHDWHGRYCVYNSNDIKEAEILLASERFCGY